MVFIYQRMLPYHVSRFEALSQAFSFKGKTCLAIEVSFTDSSYGDLGDKHGADQNGTYFSKECLFHGSDYLNLRPSEVADAVENALAAIKPSVVFSPAPAFAEGAGAMHYRIKHDVTWILMDDAWSVTDQRGWITRLVKRQFYRYVDGGFLPSPMHGEYFSGLNVPKERQRYGVDVVADSSEATEDSESIHITGNYFLFVGRLIQRKRLDVVLKALAELTDREVKLVVIGDGPVEKNFKEISVNSGVDKNVLWLGRRSNVEARQIMFHARALVVPSANETWGLVVNEAWQAGLPILGSDTVGALRATATPETNWMLMPVGDVDKWLLAMEKLLSLSVEERAGIVQRGKHLAEQHSISAHVKSALELAELPRRRKPLLPVGLVARLWKGKTVIW